MRTTIAVALLCLSTAAFTAGPPAAAAMRRSIDIPAQSLDSALQRLAHDGDLQMIYSYALVGDRQAVRIRGDFTFEEALVRMLNGSGLTYRYLDERTVTLLALPGGTNASSGADSAQPIAAFNSDISIAGSRLRLAQAGGAADSAGSETAFGLVLEEVRVTAQKRDERLQDVPVPVTAIDASSLVASNRLRLQDYFTSVPGLKVVPSVQSIQTLSIRGITTGSGNPTVGVTVDDVPYGASTNTAGGRVVPDIDPGDLARIEVLRGPQGTLYGASSMGGLIKFVTLDPSLTKFSGSVRAGTSSVKNGDGLGHDARGMVNLPLGDTWAIRGSGFIREEPGYVDNIGTGGEGVNQVDAKGGHVAALWRPFDDFSIRLGALLQEIKGDGTASADPALGDLQQSRIPGSGWYERKAQAYSASLAAKLGDMDVASISGFNINSFADSLDAGFVFGAQAQAAFAVRGAQLRSDIRTSKFTQEVRFSAPLGERIEWLLGGFYTHESSSPKFTRLAADATSGAIAGRIQNSIAPETFEEVAVFADLTVHVTDRFDVQFGGREADISDSFRQTTINAQGVASIIPQLDISSNAFTYLLTPRFRFTPDLMAYVRIASGYRAGGPNAFPGGAVPAEYEPDRTQNYEFGVKGDFLEDTLSIDASVYYIEWKDIQFSSLSPSATSYIGNGSAARSRGVELAFESRPLSGLKVAGWVAWSDAELTEAFPAGSTAYGVAGDRLPDSSRLSANLALEQSLHLWGDAVGVVGASASYVGDRMGPFRGLSAGVPLPRQTFPSYVEANLHAGVELTTWTVNLFVNNIGDERAALYGGLGALPPTAFNYIQPRTVGLSVSKAF